jgi:hypothetical protein
MTAPKHDRPWNINAAHILSLGEILLIENYQHRPSAPSCDNLDNGIGVDVMHRQ